MRVRQVVKWSLYITLLFTVILGIILIGWQINKHLEIYYHRYFRFINRIRSFKNRHLGLFTIIKLVWIFILCITVIGALLLIGYYSRTYFRTNRGFYYKKVMSLKV